MQSDGHDAPGLFDEAFPVMAAVRDDVVMVQKDTVRQPVVAHELPDVLHDVQLRAFGRQRQQGDVVRQCHLAREVPAGLVEQQHGMPAPADHWADQPADLGQVQVHACGVAKRQDERRALVLLRADGAEDVGRGVALVLWRAGPGAAPRPSPGDAVLLAYPGLVLEPDLHGIEAEALVGRDARQRRGEVFSKCSMAPSAWA